MKLYHILITFTIYVLATIKVECKLMFNQVTCGSTLKLINSAYSVRLHSHDVKYGQGSGQQSVTGVSPSDDHNSYWQVRGRPGVFCERGQPIKCGQSIRLTHLSTGRNLHSHHFSSPLSHNLEVSAFGEGGEGDEGDEWKVECQNKIWTREERVRFKHTQTGTYLHVSGEKFGRPIAGQMEISCATTTDSSSQWTAAEGVFVKPNTEKPAADMDEDDEVSNARAYAHTNSHIHDEGDL